MEMNADAGRCTKAQSAEIAAAVLGKYIEAGAPGMPSFADTA
jgi:hypothetical protein